MALFERTVELSASVNSALQHVKLALEVFYGYEICFAEETKVNASKVKGSKDDVVKARIVTFTGVVFVNDRGVVLKHHVSAICNMVEAGFPWRVTSCEIGLGSIDDKLKTWLHTQFEGHFAFPKIRVGKRVEVNRRFPDTLWIGYSRTRRAEFPLATQINDVNV